MTPVSLVFKTLPLTTNRLYGQHGGRRFLTAEARANKEAIGWEARAQYRGVPLSGLLAVEITLYWPDKRRRDLDNIKGFIDACTGIVWNDDSQIVSLTIRKRVDKSKPRVEVRCQDGAKDFLEAA